MEIANIKINIEDKFTTVEAVLFEMNNCPLCGSDLHFEHKYREGKMKIEETTTCNNCQITTQPQLFTLQ